MQLYVDLIWLLNLLFDWMILLLVAWVTKSSFSHVRIFLGALFASLIIPLTLLFNWGVVDSPIFKLGYSVFIILIAFSYQHFKAFLTRFLSFYLINFSIGGAVFGLHYFITTNTDMVINNHAPFGDTISWVVVLIMFPIAVYFTKDQLQQLTMFKLRSQQQFPVTILHQNRHVALNSFLDTGNQLKHPLTQHPVILVDEPTFKTWIDEETVELLKRTEQMDFWGLDDELQFIPYQKAGGEQGLLPAFLAEEVKVDLGQQIISTKKVYIGVHYGHFSKQMDVQCLLNPLLLQSKRMRVKDVEGVS
ncbi:sigma-E processing peptidase SpoIIGA [Alkalibacillus haloalkaliphilus]|uniref:Sporulation sigma-E factor-processing peptidase n=1 Tax=Alkalibacillus haloalkaliphilus TaxID=94136 RepID=A0A511W1C0_9BACI|nr:sigma-E processing peptidase SpoIIGA [Alkalibacillus haloalkaliphilus]GEN44827.1 sporulation sigma-E factor-processing peptidase [Alkalibacillus haloalkaliphilus]